MSDFIPIFNAMQERAYIINVTNGWWIEREQLIALDPRFEKHILTANLGLCDTEISEAIEAVRKHDPATWNNADKKDTLVREMAGCVVRLMDIAQKWQLPLAKAIVRELEMNETRGFMHGGKAL